jgi:hypothetical protein
MNKRIYRIYSITYIEPDYYIWDGIDYRFKYEIRCGGGATQEEINEIILNSINRKIYIKYLKNINQLTLFPE